MSIVDTQSSLCICQESTLETNMSRVDKESKIDTQSTDIPNNLLLGGEDVFLDDFFLASFDSVVGILRRF